MGVPGRLDALLAKILVRIHLVDGLLADLLQDVRFLRVLTVLLVIVFRLSERVIVFIVNLFSFRIIFMMSTLTFAAKFYRYGRISAERRLDLQFKCLYVGICRLFDLPQFRYRNSTRLRRPTYHVAPDLQLTSFN